MSKRIAKTLSVLLLLTAIAVTQVPVSDVEAETATSDFQMEGSKLVKYAGTAEVVSVPDHIKSIGEEAFAGNDTLVKVTIGGRVETIGIRAFADCANLHTVVTGGSVKEIQTAAFSNNPVLKNVTLGTGVKTIGNGVFAGSGGLEKLVIEEGNTYLAYLDGALYDDELTKLYAFMPAYEKTAYALPETVTEIAGYAFWGNPYLERVTLGSGLYEVPAYAFSNCQNLKNVEIPLPVRGIGAKAFEDCVNLEAVSLPDSITRVHDTAFDGCPKVTIAAAPGSYGAEFGATLRRSEVEEVEYEDVQEAQTLDTGAGEPPLDTAASEPAEPMSGNPESESGMEQPETEPLLEERTEKISDQTLLGESSIVSGRALVFIDNRSVQVLTGDHFSGQIDLSQYENSGTGEGGADRQTAETPQALLADNAQKGRNFPKYTVVNGEKIASQAFYQDETLTEYEIEDGITAIGEFAFARSGLASVVIPEGVTAIGYGAFYHCDSLNSVVIPDTVTEIAAYAFDKTPWAENMETATYPYLIVGDSILIAYAGSESVVNIPDGVKQIGAGVFKDHMGITAVNIPDSVVRIGEEAFMGCRNLKTVNGGKNLIKVEDRAFMNCPLSTVRIPASMEEIGLGAYALSGGTDTAVFEGSSIPALSIGQGAGRIANSDYRTYAFKNIQRVIVPDGTELEGTLLEPGTYGFDGMIYSESGDVLSDNTGGVPAEEESGVSVRILSDRLPEGENIMGMIPGEADSYQLRIIDSEDAAEKITKAYGELYGGREPAGLIACDMTLYDASGIVPVTRLGKQHMTVWLLLPENYRTEGLHVVTLDQDGQLEALNHRIAELEDGIYVQFTTSHFSPVGIYRYAAVNSQAAVTDGRAVFTSLSGNKDDTPDTGDLLHPKYFLALGILAAAVALFFYQGKSGRQRINN